MTVCRRHQGAPVAAGVAATLVPWMAAMAQPARRGPVVAIEWIASGSDQCPDAAYVEAKTSRLLDGATADAPRLRARAVVVRDESGPWRVVVCQVSGNAALVDLWVQGCGFPQ